MTDIYYQPVLQTGSPRPAGAFAIGWCWFDCVIEHRRGADPVYVNAASIPANVLQRLTALRAPIAGLSMDAPRIMGILNVTPDSFSDGGKFTNPDVAVGHALAMAADGADILDIGGESTRPGAATVEVDAEVARTAPVIAAIRAATHCPISIDTRKARVAQAAMDAGADLINDVAAMTFDPAIAQVAASTGAPVCLMHAKGDPAKMQDDPAYDNVLLDVYDFLVARVEAAEAAGIPRHLIVVDPGIGFGKTLDHNLTLLRGLPLFHAIGCPVLLGASRKRFIGTLGDAPDAGDRMPGSVAVALHGVASGVQFLRVHDIRETRQALRLQMVVMGRV